MASDKRYAALCCEVVALLKKERERRGLSKYVVAERSGLSQQTIAYVERGLRNPSLETIFRFASGLDLDLAKVIAKANRNIPKSFR